MITQFSGESRRDAIVNHFALDIVDESLFFEWMADNGHSIDSDDTTIESLFEQWQDGEEN